MEKRSYWPCILNIITADSMYIVHVIKAKYSQLIWVE